MHGSLIACSGVAQVNIYFQCISPRKIYHREEGLCVACIEALIRTLRALKKEREDMEAIAKDLEEE
jgi:hypothetical protein